MTGSPSSRSTTERRTRSRWRGAHPACRGRSSSASTIPNHAAANAEALHDLENGATGLSLVFAGAVGAYGYGLPATDEAITRALAGVHLDAGIGLDLDLGPHGAISATRLAALVERRRPCARRHRPSVSVSTRSAPLRCSGGSRLPWSGLAPGLNAAISALADRGFGGPICLRRRPHHPQCRRLGGAGTCLRAGGRRRLSARARGGRTCARSRAAHDLFPPQRRCR